MRPVYGRSYWIDQFPRSRVPNYPRHTGTREVDVAIIGGGLTGCATAYAFAAAGQKVVLFEAGRIGRAETGSSSGWITDEPSVGFAALDQTFRRLGGVPTYVLTDNEKTVTTEHIAGIPVRNAQLAEFARHYSVVVHTCVPADPASKGGTESSVKIAKADLVPKDTNLRAEYGSFAELEQACEEFGHLVNNRQHRVCLASGIVSHFGV